MAEVGFVGSGPNAYELWLGGSPNQTRIAKPYVERMKVQDLEAVCMGVLGVCTGVCIRHPH